ncbi:mitochondrial glycerol-3-phosphate dehydrogenase [Saitoella coloradoensis]
MFRQRLLQTARGAARFQSRRTLLALGGLTAGGLALNAFSQPVHAETPTGVPTHDVPTPDVKSFPNIPTRAQNLQQLKGQEFDLLIVGAGATGTGVAVDAAARGLRVAVVERDDFASGTSSRSTKLVHGGVRYLEKAVWSLDYGQYCLVKEALAERGTFLHIAPHLSDALPIMIPLYKWWQAPYFWAGTKAYDLLAAASGESMPSSYFLTKKRAMEAFPMLKDKDLVGALVYYDGQHNDARMNVTLALSAVLKGAVVANHVEVTGLQKDSGSAKGKITGATVRDMLTGEEFQVKAKGVINATGPFSDTLRKMDDQETMEIVAPSSGTHIILPGYYSPRNMGLIDPNTSDGRVVFFLPWLGNTIAGTTDAPCEVTAHPLPKEEEIDWILNEIKNYLSPDVNVRRGDVLAAWTGIRPLVKDPAAKNTESLVRNHMINVAPSGLLTIAGGKWTTYRQMAEDTVDRAIQEYNLRPTVSKESNTRRLKLIGSEGYGPTLFIQLIQQFGFETEVAQHLVESYGDRAWAVAQCCEETGKRWPVRGTRLSPLYPFLEGEVTYACKSEYAETAVDVLARRTRLAFLNAQASLEALPKVIDIMAAEKNWDQKRKDNEWHDSVTYLLSMGLPVAKGKLTRAQVESGEASKFDSKKDYALYSRSSGPEGLDNQEPKGGKKVRGGGDDRQNEEYP